MNYTVKLKDKSEFVVSEKQGEQIINLIDKGTEYIKINGELYSRSAVFTIEKGGQLSHQDRMAAGTERQLNAPAPRPGGEGSTCQAQHSIQWAIHQYTVKHYPRDWTRRVQNKKWREKIRQLLRDADPSKKWCDYKAGECACETGKGSDITKQHLANIRKVFVDIDASRGQIR